MRPVGAGSFVWGPLLGVHMAQECPRTRDGDGIVVWLHVTVSVTRRVWPPVHVWASPPPVVRLLRGVEAMSALAPIPRRNRARRVRRSGFRSAGCRFRAQTREHTTQLEGFHLVPGRWR